MLTLIGIEIVTKCCGKNKVTINYAQNNNIYSNDNVNSDDFNAGDNINAINNVKIDVNKL